MKPTETRIQKLEQALGQGPLQAQIDELSDLHLTYLVVCVELNRERGLMDETQLIRQFLAALRQRAPGESIRLDIPGWDADLSREFDTRVAQRLHPPVRHRGESVP
jgi:AcrR family transcriptional regulator